MALRMQNKISTWILFLVFSQKLAFANENLYNENSYNK